MIGVMARFHIRYEGMLRMKRQQTNTLPRLAVFSILVLAMVLLAACGASPAANGTSLTATSTTIRATTTPLPPTSVRVLRFGGPSDQNRVAPFVKTLRDTGRVQRLYNAVYALPPQSTNVTCPSDRFIGYELSFTRGNTQVLQVILGGGCSYAAISNPPDCRRWTLAFITQLAATLEVPETTLVPLSSLINTAGASGPFAPSGPTPPILTPPHCGPFVPTS